MANSTISRGLLLVTLAAALASPVACSKKSTSTTAPPGPGPELNSASLGHLAMYQHTFANAGTFAYHCSIHTNMHGSVIVDASSQVTSQAVSITGSTFSPASVTVAPNATVTWTNNDAINHTVTSD